MDGDLRSRFRRIPASADADAGESWGYSSTIPAEIGYPQTVSPGVTPPHLDQPPPRREGRGRRDEQVKPKPENASDKDDQKDGDKDSDKDGEDEKAPKKRMPGWKRALYWAIGLIVVAALIIAGVLYYLNARHYENTDDAFIDGFQSQVSAQVAAKVIHLAVIDNQEVTKDQLILQLDPRDYQVRVDQARAQRTQAQAQLLQAQAGLLQQQANVDQAEANVRVAEADLGQQQTDLARYKAIDPKAITRQQLDTSSAQTKSAAARLDASRQAVAIARAQLAAQKAQIEAAAANVQVADVAVANAELQLSYTNVVAPDAGRVTRRTVSDGNYVNPGQALLAIIPPDVWVTANFKETQLAAMKVGQPVDIAIDACPGHTYPGHVNSFQTGTGAVFSSLPAENATGNYVKVVQRVPVKITFDKLPPEDECRLAPGFSVSPKVTVRP